MSGLKNFRLDGKVAVITGGAGGIGVATGRLFAEAGASVVLADLDRAAAGRAADGLRTTDGTARGAAVDVTDEASVERLMEDVIRTDGRLDIVVNNAGIAIRQPTIDLPKADWEKVVGVNLTGVFLVARAAAKRMGEGGAIVNTASIMGLSGGGLYPNISYQATKGGVVNLTRALAVEWARRGIRVNAVAPTWVRTGLVAGLLQNPDLVREIERMTPLGRMAEPEEVAAAILFLASPAAAMITGHVLAVDGGFLAQ